MSTRKRQPKSFTGKNREAAKFMGVSADKFEDPGFCLLCGEADCECEGSAEAEFDRWNPRKKASR